MSKSVSLNGQLKEIYYAFFYFAQCVIYVFMHVKGLESSKSPHK